MRHSHWMLSALTVLVALLAPHSTDACGMFVSRSLEETIPTIRQEHAPIVYDAARNRQHFVREVHFDAGNGEFGFIVPTPDRRGIPIDSGGG